MAPLTDFTGDGWHGMPVRKLQGIVAGTTFP